MTRPRLGLLLADTLRSRAYAQAMAGAGMEAHGAMVITSPDRPRWGQNNTHPAGGSISGVELELDFGVPLVETTRRCAGRVEQTTAGTVNHPDIVSWLDREEPDLVVFSGFGGEIVGTEVLEVGPPLLHMHAGWLPDFRGSTTIYYSMLSERRCGVSAILLRDQIDTGPIVGRRWYPPPPTGMDIDYYYDGTIRADLLIRVLADWTNQGGSFPDLQQQPAEGQTYFVIHPVLKHLAVMSGGGATL